MIGGVASRCERRMQLADGRVTLAVTPYGDEVLRSNGDHLADDKRANRARPAKLETNGTESNGMECNRLAAAPPKARRRDPLQHIAR